MGILMLFESMSMGDVSIYFVLITVSCNFTKLLRILVVLVESFSLPLYGIIYLQIRVI